MYFDTFLSIILRCHVFFLRRTSAQMFMKLKNESILVIHSASKEWILRRCGLHMHPKQLVPLAAKVSQIESTSQEMGKKTGKHTVAGAVFLPNIRHKVENEENTLFYFSVFDVFIVSFRHILCPGFLHSFFTSHSRN